MKRCLKQCGIEKEKKPSSYLRRGYHKSPPVAWTGSKLERLHRIGLATLLSYEVRALSIPDLPVIVSCVRIAFSLLIAFPSVAVLSPVLTDSNWSTYCRSSRAYLFFHYWYLSISEWTKVNSKLGNKCFPSYLPDKNDIKKKARSCTNDRVSMSSHPHFHSLEKRG